MAYSARVLQDSISPAGVRLTTFEVTFPRIVLAEFNTHRVFSRNSASSRAIPVEKRIAAVETDPFIPESFGKNQKGMQAQENLSDHEAALARRVWLDAAEEAVAHARTLAKVGVHKQLANRLIEPFCWHTVIVTGTEWDNYWALRLSKMAQPEIMKPTELMFDAYTDSVPRSLDLDQWHMPLLHDEAELRIEGFTQEQLLRISVGRCARVSYMTHDGKRDPLADLELCERLQSSGHMSPFEHVARPIDARDHAGLLMKSGVTGYDPLDVDDHELFSGNLRGWQQLRKLLPNEANFGRVGQ